MRRLGYQSGYIVVPFVSRNHPQSAKDLNMNPVNSVFELHPIIDNPLFEGFAFDREPSLLRNLRYSTKEVKDLHIGNDLFDDFFPRIPCEWNWDLESLKQRWRPPKVKGRVTSFNDFPCVSLSIPAFSERAANALREMLEPNGELLEFRYSERVYFAFHCRKIVEILDHHRTVGAFYSGYSSTCKKPASALSYLGVIQGSLSGLTIFRMRELPNRVFVTDHFKNRVEEHLLSGFDFALAWPLHEGTDYEIEDLRSKKAPKEYGSNLKKESLVLYLPMQGPRLTSDERKRVSRIEDELDALLFVDSLSAPYYGCLEGRRTSEGTIRLYLSCPDADRLFQKLGAWLESLEWSTKPRVFLKRVPYDHTPAEQIEVFL
jgi:hypothetical protein